MANGIDLSTVKLQEKVGTHVGGLYIARLLVNDRNYARNEVTLQFKEGNNIEGVKQAVSTFLSDEGYEFEHDSVTNGLTLKINHLDLQRMDKLVEDLTGWLKVNLLEYDAELHKENEKRATNNKQVKKLMCTILTNTGFKLAVRDDEPQLPKELQEQTFTVWQGNFIHNAKMMHFKKQFGAIVREIIDELKRADWLQGANLKELASKYQYEPQKEDTDMELGLWADEDLKGLYKKMANTDKYGYVSNLVRDFNEEKDVTKLINGLVSVLNDFEEVDNEVATEIKGILSASFQSDENTVDRMITASELLTHDNMMSKINADLALELEGVEFFL